MKIQFEGISIKLEMEDVSALGLRKTGYGADYELSFWRDTGRLEGEQTILTLNDLQPMSFVVEGGVLKIRSVRQTYWPFGEYFAFVDSVGDSYQSGTHAKFYDGADGVELEVNWGCGVVEHTILLPDAAIHLESRSGL